VNEEQSTHKDSLAPTPKEKDTQPTSSTVIEDIFPAGKLTASNGQIDFKIVTTVFIRLKCYFGRIMVWRPSVC